MKIWFDFLIRCFSFMKKKKNKNKIITKTKNLLTSDAFEGIETENAFFHFSSITFKWSLKDDDLVEHITFF